MSNPIKEIDDPELWRRGDNEHENGCDRKRGCSPNRAVRVCRWRIVRIKYQVVQRTGCTGAAEIGRGPLVTVAAIDVRHGMGVTASIFCQSFEARNATVLSRVRLTTR